MRTKILVNLKVILRNDNHLHSVKTEQHVALSPGLELTGGNEGVTGFFRHQGGRHTESQTPNGYKMHWIRQCEISGQQNTMNPDLGETA